jgi:penicillin-binding protein 2
MNEARKRSLDSRLRILRFVALAAMSILVIRLWHIQFVRGAELRGRASSNRFAEREIEADRGVIYDIRGRQVVFNRPQFAVRIVPAALPQEPRARARVLGRVAEVLEMPMTSKPAAEPPIATRGMAPMGRGRPSVESLLPRDNKGRLLETWAAVTVARNVPRQAAFELMEDEIDLPGVIIGESSVREYPVGPTMAHLLGFTGSIPEEGLENYLDLGYERYDVVGRTGLEYTYEADLAGAKGERIVKVDAMGQALDTVAEPQQPIAGRSLRLTIDVELQRAAEAALQRGLGRVGAHSGAVVAIDPRNGALRALVSLPTFDNNMFSTGASPEEFAQLLEDPDNPLLNRAISGQYPPGSIFKLITASAALQEGVVSPSTRVVCPGGGIIHIVNQYDPSITYPFYCWSRAGHGSMDVAHALSNSCDVFFYEVAGGNATGRPALSGLGSQRLARYAQRFGLGEITEISLLGETSGLVPTPEWLQNAFGMYWGTGQTYIMGIGQGYTLVTPLQMANMVSAVANGGTLFRPRLVESITDPNGQAVESRDTRKDVLQRLDIDPTHLAVVRQGMRAAVQSGTAQSAWTRLPTEVAIAGKTGTAEFCDAYTRPDGERDCRRDKDGHLLTHAWFVAFAPYDNPEIALAVFVDGSRLDRIIEGSREAAPIAAEVLRAYFGIPDPWLRPPTPAPAPSPLPEAETPEPDAAENSGG